MLCWVMWSINNQQLASLHLLSLVFFFSLSLLCFGMCEMGQTDRMTLLLERPEVPVLVRVVVCTCLGLGSNNKPVSLSVNNISSDCVGPLAWPADWSVRRMSSDQSVSCFLAWGGVIGWEGPELGVSPQHCPQCPWVGVVV